MYESQRYCVQLKKPKTHTQNAVYFHLYEVPRGVKFIERNGRYQGLEEGEWKVSIPWGHEFHCGKMKSSEDGWWG